MTSAKLISLLEAGTIHHAAGRFAQAEAQYRQVLMVAPRNFNALHLLGLAAFQQSRLIEAVELLTRALRVDPKSAPCEMRLGLILIAVGQASEGEAHLRRVVTREPKRDEAWTHLGYCLRAQGRLKEAIQCHERAVALKPGSAVAWYNYGLTLSLCARSHEALACHDRALSADPGNLEARIGRAQALQQTHRIREAVEDYGEALARQPAHLAARSYRLFGLHYIEGVSREELFAEHVAYGRFAGEPLSASFGNTREPDRRLRIGVLSPDLRAHACAYFLEPLLRHLDREKFEVCLYHDHFREDETSARLRSLAYVWRNFVGRADSFVEATVRMDAPDVLIDLAGHTGFNRLPLFARRLAPVQVSYLGYPDTTGVRAMDFRFTDGIADPSGEADLLATERLVRFAPTAWAYLAPAGIPAPVARSEAENSGVVFGSFSNPSKITDVMLNVWARVLEATPGSRLLLKGEGLSNAETRVSLVDRLAVAGIAAARAELLERTADTASHLALYNRVDVALDTFPYHGTTTTCEALWMGVPVVTLKGDRHSSRVGVSLLTAAGHLEWVAAAAEDYVRIATGLAADPARRAALRTDLREELRRTPLLDHAGQSARFATALRNCWTGWCAGNKTAGSRAEAP